MSTSPPAPPPTGEPDPPPPPGARTSPLTGRPSADDVPTGTVRRTGDRVVAGVAAGVGRRYGLDPVLVRILFAVSTFAAGLGPLLYLVLWLALPLVDAPAPPDSARARARGPAFWVGAIAITVGAAIALAELPAPRILVPLALITLGVALWQRPGGSGTAPGQLADGPSAGRVEGPVDRVPAAWQPPPVPGRPTSAVASTARAATATIERPRDPAGAAGDPGWEPVPDIRWWVPPAPRPRPSWLGPVTVAVALVATGVVALLGESGALSPSAVDLVAVALLVLAGGLVVGAVRGRAKWLVLPCLALTGALVLAQGATGLGIVLSPTAGVRQEAPRTLDEASAVRHGVGELVVDLTETDLDVGDGPVDVDLLAGELQIVVPEDAVVNLRADVGAGDVRIAEVVGDGEDGAPRVDRRTLAVGNRLVVEQTLRPRGAAGATIEIDVAVGLGEVELYRGSEAHDRGMGDGETDGITLEFDVGEGGSATIETEDDLVDVPSEGAS